MSDALVQLALFSAKSVILVALILILLVGILALLAKGKEKLKGHLTIKNLNEKWDDIQETLLAETLPKKLFKQFIKDKKKSIKAKQKDDVRPNNLYVLNFNGDIKASAVSALREEVTAILKIATPQDEVVVRLESGGGMVHAYGLAAAQLDRLRKKNIPLTVSVDKIAASGGYMMACIANKILAAPFAIIGSIGVIVQLPNFNRVLKKKDIDFEMHTAGEFKRTITMFGENTDEGREKLQEEIEDIHQHFKTLITEHRPQINIQQVATGEHWLGQEALALQLVDEIKTSDDYLLQRSQLATVYELCYETKKSLFGKLSGNAASLLQSFIKTLF
jgi:serine protease SohB